MSPVLAQAVHQHGEAFSWTAGVNFAAVRVDAHRQRPPTLGERLFMGPPQIDTAVLAATPQHGTQRQRQHRQAAAAVAT